MSKKSQKKQTGASAKTHKEMPHSIFDEAKERGVISDDVRKLLAQDGVLHDGYYDEDTEDDGTGDDFDDEWDKAWDAAFAEVEDELDAEIEAEDRAQLEELDPAARVILLLGLNHRCQPMLEAWSSLAEENRAAVAVYDSAFKALCDYLTGCIEFGELNEALQELRKQDNAFDEYLKCFDEDAVPHPFEVIAIGAVESLMSIYDLAISGDDLELDIATLNSIRYLTEDQFSDVIEEIHEDDPDLADHCLEAFMDAEQICEEYIYDRLRGVSGNKLKDPELIGQILKFAVSKECNLTADKILPKKMLQN